MITHEEVLANAEQHKEYRIALKAELAAKGYVNGEEPFGPGTEEYEDMAESRAFVKQYGVDAFIQRGVERDTAAAKVIDPSWEPYDENGKLNRLPKGVR